MTTEDTYIMDIHITSMKQHLTLLTGRQHGCW